MLRRLAFLTLFTLVFTATTTAAHAAPTTAALFRPIVARPAPEPVAAVKPAAAHPTSTSFRTTPWGHGRWSETLCGAAAHFYGRCTSAGWLRIAAANHIPDPDLIQVGVRLTVPDGSVRNAPKPVVAPAHALSGWVHPLPGVACTSGWGAPRLGHSHKGVDLPTRSGSRIRAAHAGTVKTIRYQVYYVWVNGRRVPQGAGHYVVIDHGRYDTVYMHMRTRTPLRLGQRVVAGQTVGYVGSTGGSSGPHLHFGVLDESRGYWYPVNPSPFMAARGVKVGC